MARTAIVNSGLVENVIELDEGTEWETPEGRELVPDPTGDAEPGGVWDGSAFSRATSDVEDLPPLVPDEISPSQLFLGLKRAGFITREEMLAASTVGAVPAAIDALFSALPEDQEDEARVKWARMTTVERNHPLVAALAAANGLSSEEIDNAFREWKTYG